MISILFGQWILHNWTDETCLKILRNCKEALKGKNGKLVIIDTVMDKENEENKEMVEIQALADMYMTVILGRKERSLEEWSILFLETGFSIHKITPILILSIRSIIEIYPNDVIGNEIF